MARQAPFTSQQERLERRVKNLERELAATRTMVNPARDLITAETIKVTGPTSPQIIRVSEGGSLEVGNSSSWRIIDALTEPVSHTGDTIETTIHTATLPANEMGPNGIVRISSIWRTTVGGGGTWWNRIDFGGVNIARRNHTAQNALDSRPIYIWNTNDVNAQGHMENLLLMSSHFGNSPVTTAAIDTTADVDIDFTAQGGNAAHVVTLYFALVEVIHRD